MRISPKGKCVRIEGFGCPEGTPRELGCSPQPTATEVCYDMNGKVISRKRLSFSAPYPPKPTKTEAELKNMGEDEPLEKTSETKAEPSLFCKNKNLIIGLIVVGGIVGTYYILKKVK